MTLTMERTKQHECELRFCQLPQEHVSICHDHVTALGEELEAFRPEELQRLVAIARGQEKPADRTRRTGKTGKQGPADVISLPTLELAENIATAWPNLLPYLPAHPEAESLYWQITNGIQAARTKINGLYPDHRDPEYQNAMLHVRYPMKAGELIEHMWDNYRIRISHSQLRKWTQRGKLRPIEVADSNHHLYNPKQILELQ